MDAPSDPTRGTSRPTRRQALLLFGGVGAFAALASCTPDGPTPRPSLSPAAPSATGPRGSSQHTIWEETFDSPELDTSVWTAADYGGNRDLGELQYNSPAMVTIENRNLVLHATPLERDGYTYLAGSISSKDKLTVGPHGRLTTRQLLGPGAGLGFGVCLYGADIDMAGWPSCGEIDATEVALARPGETFGSVHGPGYSGGAPISATWRGPSLVDRWAEHVLEWEPGRLTWSVDGQIYHTAESSDPRAAGGWPFEQPFFLTVVLTVGSNLSGPVDLGSWPRRSPEDAPNAYAVVDFIRFETRD